MTPPALAAARFAAAMVLGAGVGLLYGFLRPLRPKCTHLADLLVVAAALWAWVQLAFGVCGGDLRPAYSVGLLLGAAGWEATAGRPLRPLFFGFWQIIGRLYHFLTRPVKKIFKKFAKSAKKLLANGKKWFTIERNISLRKKSTRRQEKWKSAKRKNIASSCAEATP